MKKRISNGISFDKYKKIHCRFAFSNSEKSVVVIAIHFQLTETMSIKLIKMFQPVTIYLWLGGIIFD